MKKQVKDNLINNYEKIKEDIDSTIDRIKNIVKTQNPKDLYSLLEIFIISYCVKFNKTKMR